MPKEMFTRYGMMWDEDCDVLDAVVDEITSYPKDVKDRAPIRFLEIGTYQGHTARGVKKRVEAAGLSLEYWGIDPMLVLHHKLPPPFEGATVFTERSDQCFHQIPDGLDLVLVDGDHSRNAVILDIFNYHTKVRDRGFMLFHDTNPKAQLTGYEYTGPRIPEFGIAVRAAWDLIGWPFRPWDLWMEKYAKDEAANGMTAFRRYDK